MKYMYSRYLVEIGTGIDLHGMDVTKAAVKAVKDASSRSCMCGIQDLLHINGPGNNMRVQVKIGSTNPDKVDAEAVSKAVPFGSTEVIVTSGGLSERGLHVEALGEGDTITVALAILTVWINTDAINL
jgi:uncharacterized protein (TIGR02058 family)